LENEATTIVPIALWLDLTLGAVVVEVSSKAISQAEFGIGDLILRELAASPGPNMSKDAS
jgi:hypothetical protein